MNDVNLLPDIKQQYLRSERVKRLFIVGSILVAAAFVAVTVLVGLWVAATRLHLNRVQGEIDEAVNQLKSEPDLDKVVTIQKQLERLPTLHEAKGTLGRLFDYLEIVVPANVSLNTLTLLANTASTMELRGVAEDTKAVNTFADTLKNARFTHGPDPGTTVSPFTNVRIATYGIEEGTDSDQGTAFTLNLAYDPLIFDYKVTEFDLIVPSITSSPSVKERPGSLFTLPPTPTESEEP